MAIYLDHNATTPLDARVLEAMLPWLRGVHGNPSSIHRPGRAARAAMDKARAQVATLINVQPAEVIFTSGGTEANNLALKGVCHGEPSGRVLISAIEHAAVLGPADDLSSMGWQVERIPVDHECRLNAHALQKMLQRGVRLISVMLANNETGAVQDVKTVAAVAHQHGALLHTDAVQAVGKMAVDCAGLGADLMSLSAHKIGGPRGVGTLIVNRHVDLAAQISGGGQEAGLRCGTENLAGIIGFGAAAELARTELETRIQHMRRLRDVLESGVQSMRGIRIFAASAERLPNTVQIGIPGFDGEAAVMELDRRGIAVSSGSACHSASGEPSHVLLAMGEDDMQARSAIRISIGTSNKMEDIQALLAALKELAARHNEVLQPA